MSSSRHAFSTIPYGLICATLKSPTAVVNSLAEIEMSGNSVSKQTKRNTERRGFAYSAYYPLCLSLCPL